MESERAIVDLVPVFVINLDRATDRWSRISQVLTEQGVSFERWRAVDGQEIDGGKFGREEIEPGVFVSGYRDWSGNEAACGVSHILLLRHIVFSGIKWSIVLEDDAQLVRALPHSLNDWRFPVNADIVFINRRALAGDDAANVASPAFATLVGGAGTEGYAVSQSGARKLLSILSPLKDPLDFQIYAHCEGVQAADNELAYWSLAQNPLVTCPRTLIQLRLEPVRLIRPSGADGATGDRRSWSGLRSRSPVAVRRAACAAGVR